MNQLNLYPYRSSAFFFNGSVGLDESLVSALCHHNQAELGRCTEWRPQYAPWEFGSHGGAAIGDLIVRRE